MMAHLNAKIQELYPQQIILSAQSQQIGTSSDMLWQDQALELVLTAVKLEYEAL